MLPVCVSDETPSPPFSKKLIIDEPRFVESSQGEQKLHPDKMSMFEGELRKFMETQGNLQTLANVASLEEFRALAAADGKRKRKKSSKQVC